MQGLTLYIHIQIIRQMNRTTKHNADPIMMARTINGRVVPVSAINNLSSNNIILGITIILALLGIIINTILG